MGDVCYISVAVKILRMAVIFWGLEKEGSIPNDSRWCSCVMLVQLPSCDERQSWQVLPFFMQEQFLQWPAQLHLQQAIWNVCYATQ